MYSGDLTCVVTAADTRFGDADAGECFICWLRPNCEVNSLHQQHMYVGF